MDRVELSREKYRMLFGDFPDYSENLDQEFMDILQRFVFGEVFHQGNLEDKTRELITIAVLTSGQLLPQLRVHVEAALRIGVTAEEIKETIYQSAPYIGFPKVLNALAEVNEILKQTGAEVSTHHAASVTEENRMEIGLNVQKSIFGEAIDHAYENSPKNQLHIQKYLSGLCFGDFYTRKILDVRMRELITFCCIASLGGCENQLKAHIIANEKVGNSKEMLVDAITQCILYIGFPRTLNALSCINEMMKES